MDFYDIIFQQTISSSGGGGGASNIVLGSFNAGEITENKTITHNISYTGSGYPVVVAFWVKDETTSGAVINTHKNILLQTLIIKNEPNTTPTYRGSETSNQCAVSLIYKSSSQGSLVLGSPAGGASRQIFTQDNATYAQDGQYAIYFKDNKTLSLYIAGASGSGLAANIDYNYCIIYSS